MNIRTLAVTVSAPRDPVFNFLADIENLPKWAGDYCERVMLQGGRWWALTAEGELAVEIAADAGCGVIDLRAGPLPERLTLTPIRVVALSPRRTLVTFTLIEAPDQGEEAFARRHAILLDAVRNFLRRFGGGEVHATDPALSFAGLGRN